jgi:hypothetical protein
VQIAGYNPDGTPYYAPDALGISVGKEDNFVSAGKPTGPTNAQMNAAGVPGYTSSSAPSTSNNYWSNLEANDPFANFGNSIANAVGLGDAINTASTAGANVASAASSVGSLLSIVTNVPRMVTIIVGLVLLIAGLFMLGAKPAVQIAKAVGATAA